MTRSPTFARCHRRWTLFLTRRSPARAIPRHTPLFIASLRLLSLSLVATAAVASPPVMVVEDGAPATLTLEEALDRLDGQSLTLAQARARADETRGLVRQALAGLLPTVGATGQYLRNSHAATLSLGSILDAIEGGLNTISPRAVTLDRSSVPQETVIQPLESFSGQVTVRVPLFAAHAYPDYFAARASSQSAEASASASRLQLRAVLTQSAWWASATEEMAAAAERALGIAEEHEKSAGRAVAAGTAAPLAALQAQTDEVRRKSELARTRADRQRAWLALGVLLGEASPVRVALPEQPVMPEGTSQSLTEAALARRPELDALEAAVRAARWHVDSAWWRLAPQLSASAGAFASTVPYVTGESWGWRATVDLTWMLYDGGLRYGKRRQAEAQLAAARASLRAQAVEVSQQVLDARRDVGVAGERLGLAERQKELALEVAASAKRSFEAGLASSLDVLDANDKLYQAEVGLAEAKARLGMAAAALTRATGELP